MAVFLPMWAVYGFLSIAYPVTMVGVARTIHSHSNGRMSTVTSSILGVIWPVTLAAAAAIFPVWMVFWLIGNYGSALKRVASQGAGSAVISKGVDQIFRIGGVAEVINRPTEISGVNVGARGVISNASADRVTATWVNPNGTTAIGYILPRNLKVVA